MAKSLRRYLRESLSEDVKRERNMVNLRRRQLRALEKRTSAALKLLEKLNTRNSKYVVSLKSLWADYGESPVTVESEGSVERAVKTAEAEFKRVNQRGDVQADYRVSVVVGELSLKVPYEYWGKYKEEH